MLLAPYAKQGFLSHFPKAEEREALIQQPFVTNLFVRHGIVPASYRRHKHHGKRNGGAMGVGDGSSCDQDYPTDLPSG